MRTAAVAVCLGGVSEKAGRGSGATTAKAVAAQGVATNQDGGEGGRLGVEGPGRIGRIPAVHWVADSADDAWGIVVI